MSIVSSHMTPPYPHTRSPRITSPVPVATDDPLPPRTLPSGLRVRPVRSCAPSPVISGPTRDLPPPRAAVEPTEAGNGLKALAGPNGTLYLEPEEKLPDDYAEESLFPEEVHHLSGLPSPHDLPADLRKDWTKRFGMPPREFYRTLFDTTKVKPGESRLGIERDEQGNLRGVDLEINLECPRTGRVIGSMDRNLSFPANEPAVAYHRLFELNRQCQGRGISKDLLANSIKLYDKAGIQKVTLQAALSVGGYAWAKYGFKPNLGRETTQLFKTVSDRLQDMGEAVPTSVRRVVERLLAKGDPKAIWAISDLDGVTVRRANKDVPLGKALLLGTAWKGALDLQDLEARARFDQYIHRDEEGK